MKTRLRHKKKSFWKTFMVHFFYVNIALYIGGEIYWDVFHQNENYISTPSIREDSDFGHLIEKYSQAYGLDWRFVSSMIQAESSFRPNVISSAGAVGLMQVLPWIAHADGVTNIKDPEENIKFGIKHYLRYFKTLKGETLEDTMKINLAAYNAGIGHIRDARRLAIKMGKNPAKWKNIEKVLPLLEQKEHYSTSLHGYCQGNSVVTYVNKIFKTYQQYREKSPAYPMVHTVEL